LSSSTTIIVPVVGVSLGIVPLTVIVFNGFAPSNPYCTFSTAPAVAKNIATLSPLSTPLTVNA
jgi:hypothetical protein